MGLSMADDDLKVLSLIMLKKVQKDFGKTIST